MTWALLVIFVLIATPVGPWLIERAGDRFVAALFPGGWSH